MPAAGMCTHHRLGGGMPMMRGMGPGPGAGAMFPGQGRMPAGPGRPMDERMTG